MAEPTISKQYRCPPRNYSTPDEWVRAGNARRVIKFIVDHKTMGTLQSDLSTFLTAGNNKSVHYLIDRMGRIFEMVDPANIAYTSGTYSFRKKDGPFRTTWGYGNENTHSISIEYVGLWGQAMTAEQREAGFWLHGYLCKRFPAIKPNRTHILGHYEIDNQKSDPQLSLPGNSREWEWGVLMSEIARRLNVPAPPPAPPAPVPITAMYFEATGQTARGAFYAYWRDEGGLKRFGYPVSAEFRRPAFPGGPEYTVQYFERARIESHRDGVLLGLVGTEAYNTAHAPGFDGTPVEIHPAFRSFYAANGGVPGLGLGIAPARDEVLGDGKTYFTQWTERGRLESHPLEAQKVQLGLVGSEALAALPDYQQAIEIGAAA